MLCNIFEKKNAPKNVKQIIYSLSYTCTYNYRNTVDNSIRVDTTMYNHVTIVDLQHAQPTKKKFPDVGTEFSNKIPYIGSTTAN